MQKFNSPLVFDFRGALNPGTDNEFSTKVYDTLGAITVHQIWLDYCAVTHENPKSGIPELEVGEAILSHFFLTMKAELGLLNKDLEWWIHKEHFSPGITSKPPQGKDLHHPRDAHGVSHQTPGGSWVKDI